MSVGKSFDQREVDIFRGSPFRNELTGAGEMDRQGKAVALFFKDMPA